MVAIDVEERKTRQLFSPIINPQTGELEFIPDKIETIINPFKNLLDMVKYYLAIFTSEDLKQLKRVVGPPSQENGMKYIGSIDMYVFVAEMYFNSLNPAEGSKWLNFDSLELDGLLDNPFFDEYKRTRPLLEKKYKRSYPMLDVYSFVRLQAYAATVLPKDCLWDVNYIWTFEDFMLQIFDLGWFNTISIIYKAYGIHWFSNNGENDPIKYKWACIAVAACKKANAVSDNQLKHDLNDIYKELLIAFTVRGALEENANIMGYVESCIIHFDEDKIGMLVDNLRTLQIQNEKLLDEKRQLNEGIELLRSQIKELQAENDKPDYDKVEEMAYRIYCLSPQNAEMDDKVEKFKAVWEKLDESTKKDIKLSISMFENFESFDLALFPIIRSLEHEFARNYFDPFHASKIYQKAGLPFCKDKKFEKTHEALIKRGTAHPTMGNIPFIGKTMSDIKAQDASNIIKAFVTYLGGKRKAFASICKSLDTYRLGSQRYKLADLRNGIAHGDDDVIQSVDEQCYKEVSKLLYEPPLQIIFELIKYSMR